MDGHGRREENAGEIRAMVFSELKPLCTRLFSLLDNARHTDPQPLLALISYVREAPVTGIQDCLDYILVPLLLILDSSVACRTSTARQQDGGSPLKIGDSVAEATLACLQELLQRCTLTSVDQMLMLLRKLASAASLSASEASEEFRHGIVRCLRTLLIAIKTCSNSDCTCRCIYISRSSLSSLEHYFSAEESASNQLHPEVGGQCLILYLQSEDASAAVGHLLSLLLQIAEAEAARGQRGSGNLRIDALETLRVLVCKIGTVDALAFFLPGVVSRLAKAIHLSKSKTGDLISITSGAAGRVGALEQAIRGLGEILVITFSDEQNTTQLEDETEHFHDGVSVSAELALETLRSFSESIHSRGKLQDVGKADNHPDQEGMQRRKDEQSSNQIQFRIQRNKDWLEKTANHLDSILSSTFPSLCAYPNGSVRHALAEVAGMLVVNCSSTMKRSKLMLLECLLALFCDDLQNVSAVALDFLVIIFSSDLTNMQNNILKELFNRLIEKLPKAVLKGDEAFSLLHAKKLLASMYFCGPKGINLYLLNSPVNTSNFVEIMKRCMSYNAAFTGSIDQIAYQFSQSNRYLPSISELNAELSGIEIPLDPCKPRIEESYHKSAMPEGSNPGNLSGDGVSNYSQPHMPPWFQYSGSKKLYECIAAILRLVGLSTVHECTTTSPLSILIEIPLEVLRHVILDLRHKDQREEDWYTWYIRTGSGRILHDASAAVCVINEIIYGASSRFSYKHIDMFKDVIKLQENGMQISFSKNHMSKPLAFPGQNWGINTETGINQHVIDCVGNILHEYTSSEVWNVPVDISSPSLRQPVNSDSLPWHFFQDTSILQQVILEGIGVFGVSLGKSFETNGFLYSSLYLLLEKLTSSCSNISSAADTALRMFAASAGYLSVKDLVMANADYIVDMLCRQLRHMMLYPHAPSILATIMSSLGAVRDIVPLLEEPIRSIAVELELLSRQHHPEIIVPVTMALTGIVKALREEAYSAMKESLEYKSLIISDVQQVNEQSPKFKSQTSTSIEVVGEDVASLEHWEQIVMELDDRKKLRLSIGSLVESCLAVSIPILGSKDQEPCQICLDIVEMAISALYLIEEALRHEKDSKDGIEGILEKFSFHMILDSLKSIDATMDVNKVLPSMNKIWPYLIACLKHVRPQVVSKSLGVIANVVVICGGHFFTRRFKAEAGSFLKLLSLGNCVKKYELQEEKPLLLPYRKGIKTFEQMDVAEGSILKVQEAFFKMIATIAGNKNSASALDAVLPQFAALSVGFACGHQHLHLAATTALHGLSNVDIDLVWLLLADITYSRKEEHPNPPIPGFPNVSEVLPPPESAKQYIWVQYAGNDYFLSPDVSLARRLLAKVEFDAKQKPF